MNAHLTKVISIEINSQLSVIRLYPACGACERRNLHFRKHVTSKGDNIPRMCTDDFYIYINKGTV